MYVCADPYSLSAPLMVETDVAALIHTFMYVVKDTRLGTLATLWWTSRYYWSGVLALVPQASVAPRVVVSGLMTELELVDVHVDWATKE